MNELLENKQQGLAVEEHPVLTMRVENEMDRHLVATAFKEYGSRSEIDYVAMIYLGHEEVTVGLIEDADTEKQTLTLCIPAGLLDEKEYEGTVNLSSVLEVEIYVVVGRSEISTFPLR